MNKPFCTYDKSSDNNVLNAVTGLHALHISSVVAKCHTLICEIQKNMHLVIKNCSCGHAVRKSKTLPKRSKVHQHMEIKQQLKYLLISSKYSDLLLVPLEVSFSPCSSRLSCPRCSKLPCLAWASTSLKHSD